MPGDDCSLCGDEIKIQVVVDPCDHKYCFQCLKDWCELVIVCPKCSKPMKKFVVEGNDQVYDLIQFKALGSLELLKPTQKDSMPSKSKTLDPSHFSGTLNDYEYDANGRPIWPENDPFGNRWALFGPYEGPKHYDWIWNIPDDVGEDWDALPDDDSQPLLPDQILMLKSHLTRDIQIIRNIGAGDFGTVHEITALTLVEERPPFWRRFRFAMKVIRPQTPNQNHIHVALNDMYNLRYLRHENICNMADIIGIPDRKTVFPYAVICLITELCDTDLQQVIEDLKATEWQPNELFTRHWFAQVCLGLAYVHQQGFIHEDIKANNIFIMFRDRTLDNLVELFMSSVIKLGDFGRAWYLGYIENVTQQQIEEIQFRDIQALGATLNSLKGPIEGQIQDIINEMMGDHDTIPTAEKLLSHSWLQANQDQRTEPFIYRDRRYPVSRFDRLEQRWVSERRLLSPPLQPSPPTQSPTLISLRGRIPSPFLTPPRSPPN